MFKKKTPLFIGIAVIVTGFLLHNLLSSQKTPMKRRPSGNGRTAVRLITVQNRDISAPIPISGRLTSYNKVELYAEVSGVLMNTAKPFKEGFRYAKGEELIRIDDRVYRNSVLSQKSSLLNQITLLIPDLSIDYPESAVKWNRYLDDFSFDAPLKPLPEPLSDKERYFIASRNIYTQYYSVRGMEETLAKYTIKAPFYGIVSVASINPGTLVRAGQKLGDFTSTDLLELEAPVSLPDIKRLKPGQRVQLFSEVIPDTFSGTIHRINDVVDRQSMTVKIYIHTRDSRLTDGMYLLGRAEGNPLKKAFTISRDLLINRSQVYAVRDSVLYAAPVTIVSEDGEQVIVRGLRNGTIILGEPWAEARPGQRLPQSAFQPRKQQAKSNESKPENQR